MQAQTFITDVPAPAGSAARIRERRAARTSQTCVVIPVYNESAVVHAVVEDVLSEFAFVVCVDDASEDDSADLIARTGATLVRHPLNLGQGAALQTGLAYGLQDPQTCEFITFDGDGQHRVEDARAALEMLRRGRDVDIVFGSRFLDRRTELSRGRRAALRLAVKYTNATSGLHLTDAHNGLRAFNRDVATALQLEHGGMAHASEIVHTVAAHRFRYVETPVQIRYTEHSEAKGQPLLNAVNIVFDLLLR